MPTRIHLREDDGAVAVVYGILLALLFVPLLVVGTTTYVRSNTAAELQRASDSGALAGAASIPFGNAHFALDYIDATSGGATTDTLSTLGLDYPYPDPLRVACERAIASAEDEGNVGYTYAVKVSGPPQCDPSYVSSNVFGAAMACASALGVQPPSLPGQPDLSLLLPALLTPGVRTTLSWQVQGPMDQMLGGGPTKQTVSSVARRRFKDMVVAPIATAPAGIGGATDTTVDINPYVGDARTFMSTAIDNTETVLRQTPTLGPCAQMLDASRNELLDAVDPPATGPQFSQVLAAAAADSTPAIIAGVVESASIPYLEFFPACIDASGGTDAYVGHLSRFGDCTVVSPGAFRASLRRS